MHIIRCEEDIALGLAELVARDPRLIPISKKAGPVPLRLQKPGYAGFADVIVSQMVSKASAAAIWKRLVTVTGQEPTAAAILSLTELELRAIGLSGAKAATLRRVAEAVEGSELDLHTICDLTGNDAISLVSRGSGLGQPKSISCFQPGTPTSSRLAMSLCAAPSAMHFITTND